METIREIERLRILADWYRGWATVSGSEEQRLSRLGLADHIYANVRALMRAEMYDQLAAQAQRDTYSSKPPY